MHRHQRRQPAFLDQRHADRGGDADRLEGGLSGASSRRLSLTTMASASRSATAFTEASGVRGRRVRRRAPVAADGEAVLVGVHVGIGRSNADVRR
jgi:hypothetical protein